MPVSQDFARALGQIRQELATLSKENEALREEVSELRDAVQKQDEQSVKSKNETVTRAAATGDAAKIKALAMGANTPVQDELLRQALPMQEVVMTPLPRNPHLMTSFVDAYMNGAVPEFTPPAPAAPWQGDRVMAQQLYNKIKSNNEAAALQRAQDAQAAKANAVFIMTPKPGTNRIGVRSPRWAGPMDGVFE